MDNSKISDWEDVPVKQSEINDWEDVQTESSPSQLAAFGRGASQGLTFGLADELYGLGSTGDVSGAASALKRYVSGEERTPEEGLSEYEKARDEARASLKESEEAYPLTTIGGNIAGGLAPILASGGLGLLGRGAGAAAGASEAMTAAKAAAEAQKLKGLAGVLSRAGESATVGAGYGMAAGVGTGEKNLSHDVMHGGLMGGVLGGGLSVAGSAIGGAAKGIASLKPVKNLIEGFKLGKAGESVGEVEQAQAGWKFVNETLDNLYKESKDAGDMYQKIKAETDQVPIANRQEFIGKILDGVEKLPDDPVTGPTKDKLKKLLEYYSKGKATTKEVSETITDDSKIQGLLNKVKEKNAAQELDKLNAPKERYSADLVDSAASETGLADVVKDNLKGKISSYGPNKGGYSRAAEKAALNNEKLALAEQEFNKYGYTLEKESTSHGDVFYIKNQKTGQREGRPYFMEDLIPEQKTITKTVEEFPELPKDITYGESKNLIEGLRSIGYETGEGLAKGEAQGAYKQLKSLRDQAVEGLPEANRKYGALSKIDEILKLDSSTWKNYGPEDKKKLFNFIKDLTDATKPEKAEQLDNLVAQLNNVNPGLGEQFKQKALKISQNIELSSGGGDLIKIGPKGVGLNISGNAAKVGNITGKAYSENAEAFKKFGKQVVDASPESIRSMAAAMASKGTETAKSLGRIIGSLENKDRIGRNAVMFTIMQNPAYREELQQSINASPSQ